MAKKNASPETVERHAKYARMFKRNFDHVREQQEGPPSYTKARAIEVMADEVGTSLSSIRTWLRGDKGPTHTIHIGNLEAFNALRLEAVKQGEEAARELAEPRRPHGTGRRTATPPGRRQVAVERQVAAPQGAAQTPNLLALTLGLIDNLKREDVAEVLTHAAKRLT